MLVINYENLTERLTDKTSVALGSFEAVHKGHIEIIKKAVRYAEINKIKSLVTIFKGPVLKNRTNVCETFSDRIKLIEELGVDIVIVLEFDDNLKKTDYESFFKNIVLNKLNALAVFSGFNYRFGFNAEGDTEKLKFLCGNEGIYCDITTPVVLDETVSSTYIYKLISDGNAEKLTEALTRNYSISGVVKKGRGIGNKLGFPTANISFPQDKAVIKSGVYFGLVNYKKNSYLALVNVGHQPTVTDEKTPKIEAFLIDFVGDLYNQEIKIEFIKRIRDIIKFSNKDELKKQLSKDLEQVKQYYLTIK